MKMMSHEEYENLIMLQKKALEFYADKNNYHGAMGNAAMVDIDEHGSQARFALKKVQETLDKNQKLQDDYNKVIGETINAIEKHPFDITGMIKTLKNIDDEDV